MKRTGFVCVRLSEVLRCQEAAGSVNVSVWAVAQLCSKRCILLLGLFRFGWLLGRVTQQLSEQ